MIGQCVRACTREGGLGGDASLVAACDCRKPRPGGLLRGLMVDLCLVRRGLGWWAMRCRMWRRRAAANPVGAALRDEPLQLCPVRRGPGA